MTNMQKKASKSASRRILLGLAPVVGALALGACGSSGGGARAAAAATTTPSRPGTITVMGHGKMQGTPDVMTISLGVQTGGPTAQAALADNNQRAQNLVGVLEQHGVAHKDLQTTDLSVFPTFDDKTQRITGYSASNTVNAKLRNIKDAGPLIDAATFVVGDAIRLNGISFAIDDPSALMAKARATAVKEAMAQARQLVAAAGVRLGNVRSIDETNNQLSPPINYSGRFAVDQAKSNAIQAGSQDVSLDVKVVVEIAQ